MKLSTKIHAASLLPFLIIIGIYHLLSSTAFSSHLIEIFRHQAENNLSRAEEDILKLLSAGEKDLKFLVATNPPDPDESRKTGMALRGLLQHMESFAQVSAISSTGMEWIREEKFSPNSKYKLRNLTTSPLYLRPMFDAAPFLGNISRHETNPLPFFDISVPVTTENNGPVQGVVWGRFSLIELQAILKRYLPSRGKLMLVWGDQGDLLAQADDTDTDFRELELEVVGEVLQRTEQQGWLEKHAPDLHATFIYRKFQRNDVDFLLLYYQPNETIYYLANRLKIYNIYVVLAGVFFFVLTSYFLLTRITTPLLTLTGQIAGLGRQYRPREGVLFRSPGEIKGDEVEQLRYSFTLFREQLAAYSEEIKKLNQTLEAQVEEKTKKLQKLNNALNKANEALQKDIVERLRVEAELEKYQEHLEKRVTERTGELSGANKALRDEMEERAKMEEELLKARKLESIGVLAGGIAHDFNNILVAVMGNISLAAYMSKSNKKQQELLNEAQKASQRARDLTRQLLTFSKGGEPVKTVAAMPEIIKESTEFVLRGSHVRREYEIAADLWPVEVDAGQMSQVIQNIILNARQSMPLEGIVQISCENQMIETRGVLPLERGEYVKISIQDSGVGIAPELMDKIFDPYITTKNEGSGLGLSICHSIIRKHGGYIGAFSKQGYGTRFDIYLPASEHELVAPPTESAVDFLEKNHGRILVMDDEEMVRDVAVMILSQFGYDVIPAGDGIETLAIYEKAMQTDQAVDLVIMDLTIPGGMGGKEALEELLKIDPHAKALVSSGYSNNPIMSDYQQYGFCGVIGKPFSLEELLGAVRRVLDGSDRAEQAMKN